MGFFDTLGKLINGQPDEEMPSAPQPTEQLLSDATRTSTGQKVFPELRVTRVKTSRNGDKMTSYAWIQNDSPYVLTLKKFYVLGQGVPMNYQLGSRQGREVKVYDGRVATSDREAHAYMDVMIQQNGDYFQQEFHTEFDRQSDGSYLIEEFHPEEHMRDT